MTRFEEHEVVLPVVVVTELEAKRHHPELGYFARQALRLLDDFRVRFGRLDEPIPVGELGGSIRVELNHSDTSVLPAGYRLGGGEADTRILAVARNLQAEGTTSPSSPRTCRCGSRPARSACSPRSTGPSWRSPPVGPECPNCTSPATRWTRCSACGHDTAVDVLGAEELPVHTGLVLTSERGRALGRVTQDGRVRLVRGDREVFGLRGRSAEQRVALDLLLDQEVGIVSMGGRAGTGKSALALCAGLEAVLERQQHRKVMVFRPLYAVGGQELGYLPGSESEKMSPWAQAVFDTLSAVTTPDVIEEVISRGMLEVLPLTHIRGRSLHDAFVIVDEAQSLERNVLLTVLSRIGQGSRVVLTHDVAQRDNLRVGRYDGVVAVVEKLKGHPLFAHITLTRSERSPIAALVTELLEDVNP